MCSSDLALVARAAGVRRAGRHIGYGGVLQRGIRRHGRAVGHMDAGRSGDQAGRQYQHAGAVPRPDVESGKARQRLAESELEPAFAAQ